MREWISAAIKRDRAAFALTNALTVGAIVSTMTNGRNDMPAFGALMSQQELRDVAAYLLEDLLRQ